MDKKSLLYFKYIIKAINSNDYDIKFYILHELDIIYNSLIHDKSIMNTNGKNSFYNLIQLSFNLNYITLNQFKYIYKTIASKEKEQNILS